LTRYRLNNAPRVLAAVAWAVMAANLWCGHALAHPLDGLSGEEITTAVKLLRDSGRAGLEARFPSITLIEPTKAEVEDGIADSAPPRRVLVVVRSGRVVHEAKVNLSQRRVESWTARPGVQPNILAGEWEAARQLVRADPRWQAGMRARGYKSFEGIFCDALSVGYFGEGADSGRRLVKTPCYDARNTNNVYARPIEGLVALVDLDALEVIEVADTGPVTITASPASLGEGAQASLRRPLRPVVMSSPAGANYRIDGGAVSWDNWTFQLRFERRVGPVLSLVSYNDHGRPRSVLYQGHLSEMFVPYMDPDPGWSYRSYMDVGEYGFGSLATELVEGVDCPAGATFISPTLPGDDGQAYVAKNAMCAFERNTGTPLWRRSEVVTGSYEGRPAVEFVLRTIPAVGNYDYIYDWVFTQSGEIRVEVGATGVAAAKGVSTQRVDAAGADTAHGALVAPNLVATYHDHFLSFRFDLDVDGARNSFVRERLIETETPEGNPRRSIWTRQPIAGGKEAALESGHAPEIWRVSNPDVTTELGYNPSYEIVADHSAVSLLKADDWPQRRAAFSAHALWVTAFDADQRYAAGFYPNQSRGGEGLPEYVNGETTVSTDVVLWYTMGFHHVTRPEDWPVLPTLTHSVTLRPHGFFTENPAMDVPSKFSSEP